MNDFTVDEAATVLGTTPMAILMLLRRGGLSGQEGDDGDWLINRASVETLLATKKNDAPLFECQSSCAAKAGGCASCGSIAE